MRRLALSLLLPLAVALASAPEAQPPAFGSAEDPFELGASPTSPDRVTWSAYGGPAFLRSDWRTGIRAEASVLRGRVSASVGGEIHPGTDGLYEDEADNARDLLRLVRYVRLQPRQGQTGLYARLGPLQSVTLGTGMLARRYRTTAAWNDRRLGAELATASGGSVRGAAFVGDVTGGGVAGAEIEIETGIDVGPARGLRVGVAAVHDLSLPASGDSSLTGVEATLKGDLFSEGGLALSPYVSYARYLGKGGGLGVGLALDGRDLGSVARAHARIGIVASRGRFGPGFIGPFYSVNGGTQRIAVANSFYDDDPTLDLAGTPIDSVNGGLDFTVDLRAVAFGRVEAMLYTRRHLGPRPLSAFSLRLAARAGETRFELGLEKQGFRSLLRTLFGGSLGEENSLILDIAVPVRALGGARAFVRSRYGYRQIEGDGPTRYLVERRFEPYIGLRTRL